MPFAEKRYLVYNGGVHEVPIGIGTLEDIDWDRRYIISRNSIIFYKDELGKQEDWRLYYRAYRDARGNVKIQTYGDDEKVTDPYLSIYVADFDQYGVGRKSVVIIKEDDGRWYPLNIAAYNGMQSVRLQDIEKYTRNANIFLFDVTTLNQHLDVLGQDNQDIIAHYDHTFESGAFDKLAEPQYIREKYRIGKTGAGRLALRMDGYGLDNEGNLTGDPLWIMFPQYRANVLSALEAGPLHFGYGNGYTLSLTPRGNARYEGFHLRRPWVARLYDLRVEKNRFIYRNDDRRETRRHIVQITMLPDGRLFSQLSRDSVPFVGWRRAGVFYEKELFYDKFNYAKETHILDNPANRATDIAQGRWSAGEKKAGSWIDHTIIIFPKVPGAVFVEDQDRDRTAMDQIRDDTWESVCYRSGEI